MGGGRRGERGRAQVRGVVGHGFGGPGPWGLWFVGPKVNRLAWAALQAARRIRFVGSPGFCRRCSKATRRGEKGNEDIRQSDDTSDEPRGTGGLVRASGGMNPSGRERGGAGGVGWCVGFAPNHTLNRTKCILQ